MKKILFAGVVALVSMTSAAFAADIPAAYKAPPVMAPVYNWTGFYVGINGGIGWARSSHTDTAGVTTGDFNQTGGLIGGTVGYNWQSSNFVLGLEGDWDWSNITGSSNTNCAVGCSTNLRSFGTLRPRVGMVWNNFMPYITGGLAWGYIDAGQPGFGSSSWRAGWTIGGGIEMMFARNWSAKLEYLYASLNDSSYTVVIPVNVTERNINIIRAGLNYHFNWP